MPVATARRLGRGARPRAAWARTSRPSTPRAGSGRPTRTAASASTRRTRTPTTSGCSAVDAPVEAWSTPGSADYAWRIWEPLLTGAERVGSAVTGTRTGGPAPLRHHREPADRHRAARGERRHRQDLDHRRPGDPVRRRGSRPARADARRDVRPGRQPGAARAGPRPAGRGRAGAQRRPRGGRALDAGPPSELVTLLRGWDDEQRRLGHRRVTEALAAFDAATIATTHQFCSMVLDSLGVAGDTDSRARLVEDLDDLVKETVDDLYLRAFAFDEDGPVFAYDEALAIARAAVGDPQARLEPADEDRTDAGRPAGQLRPRGPRGARPAQAPARDPVLRRPAQPARRRARGRTTVRRRSGCASAGRSCWSTSSRTPTRSSGRCSTARSTATPRWC